MDFWKNNLDILKDSDTFIYEKLVNKDIGILTSENSILDNNVSQKVKVDYAKDDTPIIKLCENNSEWYFDSRYEPEQVADDWVDSIGKIESTSVITMFGLGSGNLLKSLIKKTYNKVIIIVYEPCIEIFLTVLKDIDLSFLEKRVYFCVEGLNEKEFDNYYRSIVNYSNISVCKQLYHLNYIDKFRDSVDKYLKRLKENLTAIEVYRNTDIVLAEYYYGCILNNMKFIPKASILDQLKNKVGDTIPENLPAIIVSAGPSLKKNILELKKAKNKAFIIATDTALKGLFAADIMPDAFVVVDSHKSLSKFTNEELKNIPAICLETAQYIALDFHKGKKIFINDSFGYGDKIYKELGYEYIVKDSGGNVASTAFTICKEMGFNTIILVGQDLAYTNNSRYYESQSKNYEMDEATKDNFLKVEDIDGNEVYTSKDYKLYLNWFEYEIRKNSNIEVIDATEGGARIHGSKLLDLNTAIADKCTVQFDMVKYLNELPPLLESDKEREAVELIKNIPEDLKELQDKARKGVELYTDFIKELEKEEADIDFIKELGNKIGEITEEIEKMKEYKVMLHKIKNVEYLTLNNLGMTLDDAIDDANQIAKRGIIMMDAVRQISEDVLPDFEAIVKEIN